MLEVIVGEGCSVEDDGVGDGLGKCSGNDGTCLAGFVMEVISHRRGHKVKKWLGGFNLVEFQENRA